MSEQALTEAKAINYKKGIATALELQSLAYASQGRYGIAYQQCLNALGLATELDDRKLQAYIYTNLGNILKEQGFYDKALNNYNLALDCYISLNDKAGEASIYNNTGTVHRLSGQFEKARKYYQMSADIRRQLHDKAGEAGVMNNLGNLARDQHKNEEALNYYTQALMLNLHNRNNTWAAHNYENIGKIYTATGDFARAQENLQKALDIRQEAGDKKGLLSSYDALGNLYMIKKEYAQAEAMLKQAFVIAENERLYNDIINIYRSLSDLYREQGNYKKALAYYTRFDALQDSLEKTNQQKAITDMEIRYEADRREAEQRLLKQNDQTQLWLSAVGGLSFIILVFSCVIFYYQSRKNKHLSVQLLKQNQFLEHLNREKNEFLNMATHDMRSPLSSIILSSKLLKQDVAPYDDEMVSRMVDIIGQTAERMQKIIVEMLDISKMESGEMDFNIVPLNISHLCSRVVLEHEMQAKNKDITIHCAACQETVYVLADENILFQIIDNLLSNAIKYTYPGKAINISIRSNEEHTYLHIKDEGPGLTEEDLQKLYKKFTRLSAQPTAGESSTGLGLSIVKRLVESMEGEINCTSMPGQGTTFTVTLNRAQTAPDHNIIPDKGDNQLAHA